MNRFTYLRPTDVGEAVRALAANPAAYAIAGGTNLVDLMKYDVTHPAQLIDINRLPLTDIEELDGGGLRIGALVRNTDAAYDERVASRYPLLSSAILAGASPQLRNAATTGGNLLQRTRCFYFYDSETPCNKREPGTGCPAIKGRNRILAVLGTSEHCIATNPSDMNVAMAALGATVQVQGAEGPRCIPIEDFHRLPGDQPWQDTTLRHDELITAVDLPAVDFSTRYTYLKLRDRLSYAFALVSVAAALRVEGDRIAEARLALGGVAHKPWRDKGAEAMLAGGPVSPEAFEAAADHVLREARGFGDNAFKIPLARKAIVRALSQAAAGTPESRVDKSIQ